MPNGIHRANLLDVLGGAVQEKLESVSTEAEAFVRVAADWLGYDELGDNDFVDGAGDRGVDFWYFTDTAMEAFQVKSHDLTPTGRIQTDPFDSRGVLDLQRIIAFLFDENPYGGTNQKLKRFERTWDNVIATRLMGDPTEPYVLRLGLILFSDGLTAPAMEEFRSVMQHNEDSPQSFRNVPIEIDIRLYTIEDIIDARWRQDNRDWVDSAGKNRKHIFLHPQDENTWISGRGNAVFYCRAVDLVTAFNDFGYQIFEPNVRAHITKSKVNAAIQDSLTHRVSRKEFQYLNNGLTMTCTSYRIPTNNRPSFRITEPGVVNGLQTMIALHEAYSSLAASDKSHFENNCYVLVRLLRENAVSDINKVVLASNTQNPMQARNMRSNNAEQIYYEKLFAQLGWFYERKQGAWDAFAKDPKRWRTLSNYGSRHFTADRTGSRRRRVDNENIAQTWLSFIGFSTDAVDRKRAIFGEDRWYFLAFLYRTDKHASEYGYDVTQVVEQARAEAPSPALMLVSYLARHFAWKVSLSARENRKVACDRLGLDPQQSQRETLEVKLANDGEYLLEQALGAMTYGFVDFFGYLLFKALGEAVHDSGNSLLSNGSLRMLTETNNGDLIAESIRDEKIESDDIVAIAWMAYRHIVGTMMLGPWKQSYQASRNRARFTRSAETRNRVCNDLDDMDRFMKITQLAKPWAADIPAQTGIYRYFSDVLQHT